MWLKIDLFQPVNGSRRCDLLVRFGKRWRRVPGCYFHRRANQWMCDYNDRRADGRNLLAGAHEIGYFMAEPEYPPHLDLHRKK